MKKATAILFIFALCSTYTLIGSFAATSVAGQKLLLNTDEDDRSYYRTDSQLNILERVTQETIKRYLSNADFAREYKKIILNPQTTENRLSPEIIAQDTFGKRGLLPLHEIYWPFVTDAAHAVNLNFFPRVYTSNKIDLSKTDPFALGYGSVIELSKMISDTLLNPRVLQQTFPIFLGILRHEMTHLKHHDQEIHDLFYEFRKIPYETFIRNLSTALNAFARRSKISIKVIHSSINHFLKSFLSYMIPHDNALFSHRLRYLEAESINAEDFFENQKDLIQKLKIEIEMLKFNIRKSISTKKTRLVEISLETIYDLSKQLTKINQKIIEIDFRVFHERRADLTSLWTTQCYKCIKDSIIFFREARIANNLATDDINPFGYINKTDIEHEYTIMKNKNRLCPFHKPRPLPKS